MHWYCARRCSEANPRANDPSDVPPFALALPREVFNRPLQGSQDLVCDDYARSLQVILQGQGPARHSVCVICLLCLLPGFKLRRDRQGRSFRQLRMSHRHMILTLSLDRASAQMPWRLSRPAKYPPATQSGNQTSSPGAPPSASAQSSAAPAHLPEASPRVPAGTGGGARGGIERVGAQGCGRYGVCWALEWQQARAVGPHRNAGTVRSGFCSCPDLFVPGTCWA